MAGNSVTGKGEYNAYCQSCGRKYKASQLRVRPEDNLRVCPDDWEPIHPGKYAKVIPDGTKIPFVLNNDGGKAAAGGTDISGNSFPPSVDITQLTEVSLAPDMLEGLNENLTVYKASVDRTITLPTGITLTVYAGGYIKVAGTTYTAGDYAGASSGW